MGSVNNVLDGYTLVAEIARGGMGVVYLAQPPEPLSVPASASRSVRVPPSLRRSLVAVKQLKPELADDPKYRSLFLDEARLAARLVHRNIVFTHPVGSSDDAEQTFIVMEFLEGRSLKSVSRLSRVPLPVPVILRIASSVLAGLHHAHEVTDDDGAPLGVIHRAVGAENVFLTYDGQVKLIDFGIAKAFGQSHASDVGALKGRVVCMSPERLGDDDVDRRADVYAVGAMLRELLTGRAVWEGFGEVDILRDLLAKKVPPIPADVDLAPELRVIVERAMAADPAQRFPTAHAMRAALEQYVGKIDPAGSMAQPLAEHLVRELGEHRAKAHAIVDRHFATSASAGGIPVFPPSTTLLPATPSEPVIAAIPKLPGPVDADDLECAEKSGPPIIALSSLPPSGAIPASSVTIAPTRRRSMVVVAVLGSVVVAGLVAVYAPGPRPTAAAAGLAATARMPPAPLAPSASASASAPVPSAESSYGGARGDVPALPPRRAPD